jgi:putative oxidoreductase
MFESRSENRLLIPALAGFYASFSDVALTLLRVAVGGILFMHGWGKVTGAGITGVGGYMAKIGLVPGPAFAAAAMFFETIGALCLVVGLFTRFFAAALAVEMGIAFLFVHLARGWDVSKGGYEYVLVLGLVLFFIAIRGGGPYSVDAKLGKEL